MTVMERALSIWILRKRKHKQVILALNASNDLSPSWRIARAPFHAPQRYGA